MINDGAFLFFAIGLIPHNIEGKNKKVNIGFAIFGAFVADCLLAYKIDLGIHNLKEMAEVTAKVKLKNEYVRMKGALEMFLKEVVIHLDAVAFYASQKRTSGVAKNKRCSKNR